jgi:hypothetical protein
LTEARKNIRLSKKLLGLVDLHTARAYIQAANECEVADLIQEAHDDQKEAWQLFADTLGPSHFSTQEAKNDLLRLKEKLGLVEEALQVHRDTVNMWKAHHGPTDPSTLESVQLLIEALLKAGKQVEALKLAEETLAELSALSTPAAEIRKKWLPAFEAMREAARQPLGSSK